jgi:hypothetical protein
MSMLDDPPVTGDDEIDESSRTRADEGLDEGPVTRSDDDELSPFQRWRRNLPLLIVVVLAWMVAAGAVILWRQNQDLKADRDERREAAGLATEYTTAVLGYDHRELEGALDEVLTMTTTDWGRTYEDAWFQDQQPLIEATRARATVEIHDVLLGEASNGVLPAMVSFDATIRSQVCVKRLTGSFLQLDLVQVDGAWKVDDMTSISQDVSCEPGAGGEGETPAEGATPPAP